MANNELIMTLGKVLIAVAWADGEIAEEEVNSLKDLLWRLPAVGARDWDELDIYLDASVDAPERERLVARLRELTTSAEARTVALQALDDMIEADGEVSERERGVVDDIKRLLETADVGLWGSLSRMLVGRRAEAAAGAPSREAYLNDFVRNRVYYKMRQRLATENVTWEIADDELRRLGLAGGLLALVGRVADDVSAEERAAMVSALQSAWALAPESAAFVVEVALANGEKLDLYRLTREFSEMTTYEQRRDFLDALFAVAGADEKASFDEIEQIRLIALGLKLSHQEFIDAKMRLPRDERA
ncbi:MAG: TerB family tellurite resistance protein [Candidatus Promineofilum sp.]|nr:TerB family tellurite resistance protein [Promineifilum sp.]